MIGLGAEERTVLRRFAVLQMKTIVVWTSVVMTEMGRGE